MREYFKAIVISGEVGIAKPDPAIYQLALDKLGASADQTLFIGDHPVNDIWGAGKAYLKEFGCKGNILGTISWTSDLGK